MRREPISEVNWSACNQWISHQLFVIFTRDLIHKSIALKDYRCLRCIVCRRSNLFDSQRRCRSLLDFPIPKPPSRAYSGTLPIDLLRFFILWWCSRGFVWSNLDVLFGYFLRRKFKLSELLVSLANAVREFDLCVCLLLIRKLSVSPTQAARVLLDKELASLFLWSAIV